MTDPKLPRKKRSARKKSKRGLFVRGLITLLPAALTIFILVTVLQFVNTYLTSPINKVIYGSLDGNGLGWNVLTLMEIDPYDREFLDERELPVALRDEVDDLGGFDEVPARAILANYRETKETFLRNFKALAIDGEKLRAAVKGEVPTAVGILISVSLVLVACYFAGGFLGRRAISSFDRTLSQIPIIKSVYPYTKQIVEFFLSDKELEFDTVVAAPYPTDSVWAIGFVTGNGLRSLNEETGGRHVSVFIPTSPMPMTGFTVFIDSKRLIPLDLTVDEALRITVSAGVLVPKDQLVAGAAGDQLRPKSTAGIPGVEGAEA
ncbi:MAG: DUF502 domain-containing protein [Planctomycetota bacterium]|nr:MAG: DUF502 domain-containing protein [Planctomycetota bacterium]